MAKDQHHYLTIRESMVTNFTSVATKKEVLGQLWRRRINERNVLKQYFLLLLKAWKLNWLLLCDSKCGHSRLVEYLLQSFNTQNSISKGIFICLGYSLLYVRPLGWFVLSTFIFCFKKAPFRYMKAHNSMLFFLPIQSGWQLAKMFWGPLDNFPLQRVGVFPPNSSLNYHSPFRQRQL